MDFQKQGQNPNLKQQVEIPHPHPKPALKVFLIALTLTIAGAAIFYVVKIKPQPNTNNRAVVKNETQYPKTLQITFPTINSKKTVDTQHLGIELSEFFSPKTPNVSGEYITYQNGNFGFNFSYTKDQTSINDLYQHQLEQLKYDSWKILSASQDKAHASLEASKDLNGTIYEARANYNAAENSVEVTVQYLITAPAQK